MEKTFNRISHLLFALSLSYLCACQTTAVGPNPDKIYRRDMSISVNGVKGEGVMVVPKANSYSIQVEAKAALDLFTLQSCHREVMVTDVKEGGFWSKKSKVKLDYYPSPGVEDNGSCSVQLGGYEKAQGRHSWAFIDFETPAETLKAQLYCNGDSSTANGVSICQSRMGLIQKIIFEAPVVVSPDEGCELPKMAEDQALRFIMPKGTCVYLFVEKAKPHRAHRLTTIGYEDILIRVPGS